MGKKYIVTLTDEERKELLELVNKGNTQGYKIKHAQILLGLDENQTTKKLTREEIRKAYRVNPSTISQIAQRFVEEGIASALGRKEQQNRFSKIDGKVEAHIIATACSESPQGRERWTLQLIADQLVQLNVVESISAVAVGKVLKKRN